MSILSTLAGALEGAPNANLRFLHG